MHTITRSPREMTSRDLALPIPANRTRCPMCDGTGDDTWTTGERCDVCSGFGHVAPNTDLDPIWQRTAAASLIDSDRANAD